MKGIALRERVMDWRERGIDWRERDGSE